LQNFNTEDLAVNDFRRETTFHRQAQAAVLLGIPRLREHGVKTKRPDDYFAEMAKSDQHMQKVSILLWCLHCIAG
jgi:rRNA-processing protein EBP2